MESLKSKVSPDQVTILISGNAPVAPQPFTPTDGVLVWRDTTEVILVWDRQAREWCPNNCAGWAIATKTEIPSIPLDHWAVVDAQALKGLAVYGTVTKLDLIFAFVQCVDHPTHAFSQPADDVQTDVADAIRSEQYA